MIPDQTLALEQTPLAKGVTAAGFRDIPQLFVTEKALAGAQLGTSVKAVSIPSEDPTKSANILGSNGISIPQSCDNPATAASWTNYFTNDKDAALAFQSDNGILTNTAAQEALLADSATPAGVKQNVTILRSLTEKKDLTTTTYPAGLRHADERADPALPAGRFWPEHRGRCGRRLLQQGRTGHQVGRLT